MTGGQIGHGGGRFSVAIIADPPAVEKRGDVDALTREARALRRLAGAGLAPRLIAATPGRVVTEHLPGRPHEPGTLTEAQLRRLGSQLRRLHDLVALRSGGLPHWRSRTRSLAAYAARRLDDAGVPSRAAAAVAAQVRAQFQPPATDEAQPFRMVHGDLVWPNVVWTPDPRLVDWEFWRIGDPAEDLAYLCVVNELSHRQESAVLRGYGPSPARRRIDMWRPICALEAAVWYLRERQPDRAAPLLEAAARLSAPRPGGSSRR